jgi:hypothetical protein
MLVDLKSKLTESLLETYDEATEENKRLCYQTLADDVALTMADVYMNLEPSAQTAILHVFSIKDPMDAIKAWEMFWTMMGKPHMGTVTFLLVMRDIIKNATSPEVLEAFAEEIIGISGPEGLDKLLDSLGTADNLPKSEDPIGDAMEDAQLMHFFDKIDLPKN